MAKGKLQAVPDLDHEPTLDDFPGALGLFEGRPVGAILLIVAKAGDGLSKSMNVQPKLLEIGDRTGVLILGETSKVRHQHHKYEKGEEDRGGLDRVQVIDSEGAVLLPDDEPALGQVRAMISEIRKREKAREDAKKGQQTLDVDGKE